MSERPLDVIVIGAGLGGACLAHGLKRAGLRVGVYEREPARHGGFYGFRVTIGPRGAHALRTALPPDLYQTYVATCAEPPRHLTVYSAGLDELVSTVLPAAGAGRGALAGAAAGLRSASPMTVRQLLLTGIEDITHYGKEFVRYEQRPGGRITAFFADGSAAVGDVLVGADGAHSRVRRQYLPGTDVHDSGFAALYGQVDLDEAASLLPRQKMTTGISVLRDRHGLSFIAQAMRFHWTPGGVPKAGLPAVDSALITTWPGRAHDTTRDHLMWGCMVSSRLLPAAPAALSGAGLLDLAADLTGRWHPAVGALVRRSDPATAGAMRAVTSRPPGPRPPAGVALLGDASQVRTPDPGQGANETLHAAVVLCRLLARAAAGGRGVSAAISEYETQLGAPGAAATRADWACLSRRARLARPVIGPVLAAGTRTRLRVAGQLPALRKRVAGEFGWLHGGRLQDGRAAAPGLAGARPATAVRGARPNTA